MDTQLFFAAGNERDYGLLLKEDEQKSNCTLEHTRSSMFAAPAAKSTLANNAKLV